MPKTVLIISYECYPYNRVGSTIGAQRPYQFAKYLSKSGWRVILVCCDVNQRRTITKKQLPGIIKNKLLQTDFSASMITIALPSLKYNNWLDRIWFASVNIDEHKGTFSYKNNFYKLINKPLTFINFLLQGDYSQSWINVAKEMCDHIIQKEKISIMVAEHGPSASLYIAKKLHSQHNIPWITDFRDPILRYLNKYYRVLYRNVSKQLLSSCSATINVNEYWSELDGAHINKPFYTVTNGYDETEFVGKACLPADILLISYMGSVSEQIQDVDLFFRGYKKFIDRINDKSVILIKPLFRYRGSASKYIQQKAKEYDVEKWCDIDKNVTREEALKTIQSSHLLLALTVKPSMQNDLYLKKGLVFAKLFEYIATGNKVIAVPGDNGIMDDLIFKTHSGVILNDTAQIEEELFNNYQLLLNKESISNDSFIDEIKKYSRENQAKLFEKILNKYALS